jgi:signal transduction histidine kinase
MHSFSNVLVIEDNPGDARLVGSYLADRFGPCCAVRQAATLADGLDALRTAAPDVVLLDLGLPDSQGLAGYLAVQRAAPNTPVVIMSGLDDDELARAVLGTGAEDYLAKADTNSATLGRAVRHAVQRRRLGERLRSSEARFRAIVETAEEGILQLGADGQAVYANARARAMLLADGLPDAPPATDPAAALQLLDHVAADDQPAAQALLATAPGDRRRRELQLGTAGGARRWVLAAAGGVAQPTGSAPQVVVLLTDIDGHKRAQHALQTIQAGLERRVDERTASLASANTELRALSQTMAHDLRTPLHGIIGMARLVIRDARAVLPTNAWRYLQLVEETALEMSALIDRLMSLATLRQQDLVRAPLDLSALARGIAGRLTAAQPQRTVRWLISDGLGASGDTPLVASVLQNLLENAWKYTASTAEAVIEFGREPQGDGAAIFFVRDNGVGFDMAQAGRLFTAFERLPSSAGHAGSGLGLFGAKRIIERHGGSLWAESMPGVGAVFRFTLGLDSDPVSGARGT